MVTVGLLFLADLIDVADPAQRRWFILGLAFCLFGDPALMWQPGNVQPPAIAEYA